MAPVFEPIRAVRRALAATGALVLGALALGGPAQADTPCPPGARCGSVTVPLDRRDAAAGTIDIAYARFPRTDTSRPRLGTIAPNPGGPGNSTIAAADLYTKALAPLRARRDLLLVAPRGTGRSGALSCPSVAAHDPLTLDLPSIGTLCAGDLGPRARLYGTAAAADDIDAVRAALGVRKLDLWGDSYGTLLMPVYAARHPTHVRSIVLDGAFPIESDPWGRDVLHGVRRVIGLVCRRTQRCSGPRVLAKVGRLARRLRRHPVTFTAQTPVGPVPLTIGEHELASVVFGGGHPEVYGLLPSALDAALDRDFAPLERLVTADRVNEVEGFLVDPAQFSIAAATAVSCKDYPRPFDRAAPPAVRRAQYDRALASLDRGTFRPFSAGAWLSTAIDAGPKCLDWPADPTAGSPLRGHSLPDVPVLVQSGDLDTNTPIEQGRKAAAQFAHATFAVVSNAGHTPDLTRCGQAMAIDFIRHLRTNPNRCAQVGRPPVVTGPTVAGHPIPERIG
jgi:pimeloyl-ACP methyl ester carboxylesterase